MSDTAAARRHFLVPKPKRDPNFLPALSDRGLAEVVGQLAPAERRALACICETADLLDTEHGVYLVIPAHAELIETLAVFGADIEDRENDLCDEGDEGKEDDSYNDNALDAVDVQSLSTGRALRLPKMRRRVRYSSEKDERELQRVREVARGMVRRRAS